MSGFEARALLNFLKGYTLSFPLLCQKGPRQEKPAPPPAQSGPGLKYGTIREAHLAGV